MVSLTDDYHRLTLTVLTLTWLHHLILDQHQSVLRDIITIEKGVAHQLPPKLNI